MNYSNMGMDVIAGSGPSTGFTPPTVLWERMRDVDNGVEALNRAIQALPTKRQAFLSTWMAWYKHWKDLVARYDSVTAKAAAVTYSDELASEIEQKRIELHNWEDAYRRERPEGAPENPPIPGMPTKPPNAPEVKGPSWMPKLEVPWWVWVIGAGAFVGLGALIYHRVKNPEWRGRVSETSSRYGLPGVAKIESARGHVEEKAMAAAGSAVGRDPAEDIRYAYGMPTYGGLRMCPCPHQNVPMATWNPED